MTSSRRIIASIAALVVGAFALTACAIVSEDKVRSCENSGGRVTSERYAYIDAPDDFWLPDTFYSTYPLYFCESPEGAIKEVYNEVITELPTGLFAPNWENRRVFEECARINGVTYRTPYGIRKSSHVRYACVVNGAYHQVL